MGSEDASRPVWILAGPGCAELASVIFPGVQCYDWEEAPAAAALAGRELTLWGPSWTDSTKLGARYVKQAASVALVDVREDDNIDFASLLQKRRDADSVHDFAKLRSRIVGKPGKALTQSVTPAPSAYATWQDLGLDCNSNGEPFPTIANAASILLLHPPIKDRIWFNAFTGKIMQTIDGVDSEIRFIRRRKYPSIASPRSPQAFCLAIASFASASFAAFNAICFFSRSSRLVPVSRSTLTVASLSPARSRNEIAPV